jgi:prepilin-type processing-associated H-X9-DG protein
MERYVGPRFGLKELLVVVGIIGTCFGLTIQAVKRAREAGRRTQCANNMRQLGLALLHFSSTKNRYPNAGTFFDDPAVHQADPTKSNIYLAVTNPGAFTAGPEPCRSNWFVEILPYIDVNDASRIWDVNESYLSTRATLKRPVSNTTISNTSLGIVRCPDDPTAVANQGNLSYVVNGGFSRWPAAPVSWHGAKADGQAANGGELRWTPPGTTWQESQAIGKKLGVMFLGTQSHDQPWDIFTTPADIIDGSSNTLLIAENTLVGASNGTPYSGGLPTNWACPLPNFCMFIASDDVCRSPTSPTDCTGGQLRPPGPAQTGPGWSRANQVGTYENIGFGQALTVEGSFPFANSGHSGGGNFAFCDGAVRFLTNTIDGHVYANLITPAGIALPNEVRQRTLDSKVFDSSQ